MKFKSVAALPLLALLMPVSASAESASEAAAKFGSRQTILDASISPDGQGIAFIAPGSGSSEILYSVDLAGNAAPTGILRIDRENEDLNWCRWATNSQLVCQVSTIDVRPGELVGYTRLYSLEKDGGNLSLLTARPRSVGGYSAQQGGSIVALDAGEESKILITREFVPDAATGTILGRGDEGLGVEEVDLASGKRRTVEKGKGTANWYAADENGVVRAMATQRSDNSGYDTDQLTYFYREAGSRTWKELDRVQVDSQTVFGFSPEAVDSAKNVVYGFENVGDHLALVSYSLDGARTRTVVLARPDADVDSLLRIGRKGRVVGASWATERREVAFFDPELKALADALGKALPGKPTIQFVDANEDESKLLLIASSDVDPGKLYMFDKATKQLGLVMPMRPELAQVAMGSMKPVTFPAGDGTQIPGYLTLPPGSDGKNLPAIVLPHGGPTARDEWGFDWLVQYFAARGYAVLQPNFRGSSGYGSAWFQDNGFKSWKTAIGDVNDAGRWLVSQGIADPAKMAIVGWSYGGYAALQSQVLDPQLYKAVVAIAPVTDLERLREDHRRFTDFRLVSAFVGDGPHVVEGSPARQADRFAAPVLMFHGDYDQNVDISQSRLMADRLKAAGKDVKLVEFDELDHYIDDADKRPAMLTEIDAFLTRNLKR